MDIKILNAYARETVGVPYKHQGRCLRGGMDCGGPIVHILEQCGFDVIDHNNFSKQPANGLVEQQLSMQPCLEKVYSLQAGDFVVIKIGNTAQHLAYFTGENLIHTYEAVGRVVEHRLDEKWRSRIAAIYRIKG